MEPKANEPDSTRPLDYVSEADQGPIGIFPTWRALYITVVLYAFGLITLFYVLSQALSFGSG